MHIITASRGRWLAMTIVGAAVLAMMLAGQPAVSAGNHTGTGTGNVAVVGAKGLAFNYYTDVGLFGGPPTRLGYGETTGSLFAPLTEETWSPSVECPEEGGTDSETKPEGARANYGPATIFGGIWPWAPETPDHHSPVAPPSGPLTSEIDCGDEGVTASTLVTLMPDATRVGGHRPDEGGLWVEPTPTWTTPTGGGPYPHPGGIGPGPLIADQVESTCTMNADGTVTSNVRFVNGFVETSYDPNTQDPATWEDIPNNPPPGHQVEGTIDHVGDRFRITFNEQIENPDGSFTVNAAHMELLGEIAVGDMVIGSVTCGPLTTITSADCMNGGWEEHGFRNQGQCVRFVEAEG